MTTMTVRTLKRVAPLLPAETSVLFRGAHGIGKSQLVRQIARLVAEKQQISDFELIDRRLSQQSEGDFIGLPSNDGEVTRFNPPDWYKRACVKPCMLFMDELNRATPEVMQAAFQIVLDRELNGWKLHPQTLVYSAINFSAEYTVNEVDPALLDRFWVVDLQPDVKDWLEWAADTSPLGGNIHPNIIEFITAEERWLDTPKTVEPGTVTVSRRSWERLNRALVKNDLIDHPENDLFYSMSLGYIGLEASIRFTDFVKQVDNRFTGEDIINSYLARGEKIRKKVTRGGKQQLLLSAIEKAADYIHTLDKVSEQQGKNLQAFMKDLPGELRVALWAKMIKDGERRLELTKSIHQYTCDLLLAVYGVPRGPAGIGVIPNIPDVFSDEKDKQSNQAQNP